MPQPRRRTGFPQKTKARRFVVEISCADDLQRHRAAQIDIERFVSDAHCSATQLNRLPVFARHQLVVLKSLHHLFRCCRLHSILEPRLAGFNPASESLAKHADRTEFHCSGKLITATGAAALGLRAHGPNRPSDAIKASQRAWISSSISA